MVTTPFLRHSFAAILVLCVCAVGSARAQDVYLDVVISEIMYHAPGNDARGEFLELHNRGGETVSLAGWRLEDGIDYTFPLGVTLAPGARLVVAGQPVAVAERYGLDTVYGPYSGRLSNDGERIALANLFGGLVNEVWYEIESPWPTGAKSDGRSLQLIDPWRNNNVGRHWRPSAELLGNPGQPNNPGGERPVTVVVNEFLARSSVEDWLELYNYGDQPVDLDGYYLTDDPDQPTRKRISADWAGDTVLPPGGFLLAYQSQLGFAFSSSGEQVYLIGPDGRTWIDGYDFGAHPAQDVSEGRYPDGPNGVWTMLRDMTPGAPNTHTPDDRVVMNEIMYHPPVGDPGPEYLELHNRSSLPVSLHNWSMADGIRYTFPSSAVIPAGGYLVLGGDPALVESTYGISGVFGPYSGRLSNFSDRLELRDELGNLVDLVEYKDEGQWPESPDGDGPSLELINPAADNRLPGMWAPSVNHGGTPGAANSRFVSNPGASVDQISHRPVVPNPAQAVTVTALAAAGDLQQVRLFYRATGTWQNTVMTHTGDGWHVGEIPPQPNGTTVEFYVQAQATGGNAVCPPSAPTNNALYMVEETTPDSNLTIFRFLMTQANHDWLHTRNPDSNVRVDCTFIHGEHVYYNSGVRFRSGSRNGPKYSYKVHLPPGIRFREADRFNLNFEKNDATLLKNKIANNLLRRMELPDARTEFIHTRWRGNYAGVHLFAEAQGSDYVKNKFPDDDGGNMYKADACCCASLHRSDDRGWYQKDNNASANDWSDFDAFRRVLSDHCPPPGGCWPPCPNPPSSYADNVLATIDLDNWTRGFAVWGTTVMIDSIWHLHGQNYRVYRGGVSNRWYLVQYDWDDTFWSTMLESSLYSSRFSHIYQLTRIPAFRRAYEHQVWRCVRPGGFFHEDRMLPELLYYHNLIYDDVAVDPYSSLPNRWFGPPGEPRFINGVEWLHQDAITVRNTSLRSQIPIDQPFVILTNNGADFETHGPQVEIEGRAPIEAAWLSSTHALGDFTWHSNTRWRVTVALPLQVTPITITTHNEFGAPLQSIGITITRTDTPGGPTSTPTATHTASPTPTLPSPGANLLINPGAEMGNMTGWSRGGVPSHKPFVDPSTHPPEPLNRSGNHRFGSSNSNSADHYMFQTVVVRPGLPHEVSLWVVKRDGTNEFFDVYWIDGPYGGTQQTLYALGREEELAEWTLLNGATFVPSGNQATLLLRYRHDVPYASVSSFHVDDIYLGEIPRQETPTPLPTSTFTATPTYTHTSTFTPTPTPTETSTPADGEGGALLGTY